MEHNSITLNKKIIEVWNKWILKFGYKKSWRDKNIANRLIEVKVCGVNT